jgi:adenylate cyclase
MTANKNIEIERKFLVDPWWTPNDKGTNIIQFYLSTNPTVRVRIAGDKAFVTIKGPTINITRPEFEYEIPIDDAKDMIKLSISNPVQKIRYDEIFHGKQWTIDMFLGENAGLIVAEIELESEDQEFDLPKCVIKEVSDDSKYSNSNLAKTPFQKW